MRGNILFRRSSISLFFPLVSFSHPLLCLGSLSAMATQNWMGNPMIAIAPTVEGSWIDPKKKKRSGLSYFALSFLVLLD